MSLEEMYQNRLASAFFINKWFKIFEKFDKFHVKHYLSVAAIDKLLIVKHPLKFVLITGFYSK